MKNPILFLILLTVLFLSNGQALDSLASRYESEAKKYLFVNKDSASKYLNLFTQYAEEKGLAGGLIEGYKLTGILKFIQSDYDSSLYYYNYSKQIATKSNDLQSVADVQSNIGLLENSRGNFKRAIEVLTEACVIYDSLSIADSKGRALINIGMSYESLGLLKQTEKVLLEAIHLLEQTNSERDLAKCYLNLGLIKKKTNSLDSALTLYNKALVLMNNVGDVWGLAGIYNNLGSLHSLLGNPDMAIDSYQKSIDLKAQLGDRVGMLTSSKNLSVLYKELGNLNQAKKELDKGYEEVLALGDAELIKAYYMDYATIHEELQNYEQSVSFYKKYLVINDSLVSSENARVVSEIENKYQSERKDQEIELLAKTNEVRLGQRNVFLSVAIGLFLVGLAIYFLFNISQKKNQQLAEKNHIIEEALEEREILLREIHHRVKNNLQIVSSLLNVQSKLLKDPSAKKAVQAGRDRVQSMALTHKLLYQNQNLSNLSLKEYISQLTDNLVETYGASNNVSLAQEIDEVLIDLDTAVNLGLLINELISNAMKHAFNDFQDAAISIFLRNKEKHLELIVADNGKGMDSKQDKSDSYGMRLIRSLSDALRGQLSINAINGTEVKLIMPI